MPFSATVLLPSNGDPLSIEYGWPDGYKLVDTFMDEPDHRYHLAFFEPSSGAAKGKIIIKMDTIDPNGSELHSLSAIAVCGNKVVERDRKLVKDAVSEGP